MKKILLIIAVSFVAIATINAQRIYKPNSGSQKSGGSTSTSTNSTNNTNVATTSHESVVYTIPKMEYKVRVAGTSQYWDIPGHPDYNSKQGDIQVWGDDNGADRKVMFIPAGDGYYYIKFSHNGYYLDVKGGNINKNVHLQIYQPNRSDAQKFRVIHKGNGQFKFLTNNGYAIDCEGGGWKNGVKLQLWDDHGKNGQTFEIVRASNYSKFIP